MFDDSLSKIAAKEIEENELTKVVWMWKLTVFPIHDKKVCKKNVIKREKKMEKMEKNIKKSKKSKNQIPGK